MDRVSNLTLANRKKIVPLLVVALAVSGLAVSLFSSKNAQADYYVGCGYGYSSNGSTFGFGSNFGYGYLGTTFAYGYGNTVCPQSSSGATTTTTVVANAPAPPVLSSSSYGTPASSSVNSSGGVTTVTNTGSATGSSATVTVPAGALPVGTTVSVYPVVQSSEVTAQVPANNSYVISFAVSWETTSGTSPTSLAPITLTITDPSIKKGDTIYELTANGPVAVGVASADGTATITFTTDPTFIVTTPKIATSIALSAAKTNGYAHPGAHSTLVVVGTGFYAQPKVTSNQSGTKVGVVHDTGSSLVLSVYAKPGSAKGVHTFTIVLANGKSVKVNYLVK